MDFSSWTNNMIAALIQIRGEAAPSPQGHRLPSITALDTIAILGRYAPALKRSIEGLQLHHDAPAGAIDVRSVNQDGTLDGGLLAASDVANRITLDKYLAGYGVQPLPYNRRTLGPSSGTQYTFYIGDLLGTGETALVSAHREAVREWQRAIDASSSAIIANASDMTRRIGTTDNVAFWSAIRGLAASLAAIAANPPEDVFSRVKEATSKALDDTAQFVGKSAAQVAGKVGEIAGEAAQGFFAEAGLTAMLVASLAVYMVVR